MLYLDTRLLVAVLTPEARTHDMQDWLASQAPGSLAISEWVLTEFSSALSMKTRMGDLGERQRAKVLSEFTSLVDDAFGIFPVVRADFRTAARFADQHDTGLRSGDALHLAIAFNHGACLCTLDKKLVAAADMLGVNAESL
ncbi:PilT protein domain-containing protein [Salinisphaera sp. PC39]|uniref:type II toxin-antitoxin system VapC family toxin n=1 Tax=Salinisphaera sp. PC39 TaxID=1304156 RepID=UPI00333F3767